MTKWLSKLILGGILLPDTSWVPYYDFFPKVFSLIMVVLGKA